MIRRKYSRIIALFVAAAVVVGSNTAFADTVASDTADTTASSDAADTSADGSSSTSSTASSSDEYENDMLTNNYTNVSQNYTAPTYQGETVVVKSAEAYDGQGGGTVTSDTIGNYADQVIDMSLGDSATIKVTVPETAQYVVSLDYLSYDDSILPIEASLKVDGDYPFYETRRLTLESTWVAPEEKSYDRYGNEIVPVPDKEKQWENKAVMDASYRYSQPLNVELTAGEHEFTIDVSEGNFYLGNIYLEPVTEIAEYQSSEKADGDELITIQGEDPLYRNDSSIRAIAEYDVNLDPYSTSDKLLNTIDRDSFVDAGQKVTYSFEVAKAGYYDITPHYVQSEKNGFPVFVDVAVDGEIPNTAFQSYPLAYTTKYVNTTLQDEDGNNLTVYLEEGTHTISFQIVEDNLREVLEAVDVIMSGVNDLALDITKVAGTNQDKYRDLKLEKYIPDISDRLNGWADEMEELIETMKQYTPNSKKTVAAFSSMTIAINQLRDLAEEPNEIPYRSSELCESQSSVNQNLANLIDILNSNELAFDRIYIHQDGAKLPKSKNIVTSAITNVKRFVSSFAAQAYSTSNTDPSHLKIWVNRPRAYLEIMQQIIDEEFTPETGITVDLCLMPDQNKLVLANSTGDAPDIAMGINYTIPYELAIRGALKPLTEFEDFSEVSEPYPAGLFIPSTIGDQIYSLPETMNFWVLFYRTDVMDKMGLSIPDTIEDVQDMLPDLQMRGLNFFYPTAGMITMRNFHGTAPLVFQSGSQMFGTYGSEGVTLNSEEAINGLTTLTELFTIFNCPVDVQQFYQRFRNGNLPIGIGDYGVYNLLTNAAPEIANSWAISVVPGTENEDGEVERYTCGGAESSVIFRSTEDREDMAWEFLKWWSADDVQAKFGQTLQISYGSSYIWNTANLNAFDELPWDSEDKQIIKEQAQWLMEVARIPGTYLLERELSNAFNDIVVNGKTLRTRIDKAVKTVNREIDRKLEEFGYTNGNTEGANGEYVVPTLESVKEILGRE
jgi:ABC-type glycerol-3-phosphate transport system substrate-binding protein